MFVCRDRTFVSTLNLKVIANQIQYASKKHRSGFRILICIAPLGPGGGGGGAGGQGWRGAGAVGLRYGMVGGVVGAVYGRYFTSPEWGYILDSERYL